ncbi:MAG: tetratricopeptide repeat protein [Polyangiales bacterium]
MATRNPGAGPIPAREKLGLHDLFVVLAAVATFARGVANPLVRGWDDGRFLVDFEPVQSISLDHLVAIFRESHFEAYHPLHLLSYWLDVPFAGPSGPVLHATSLALFALALLLVRRVFLALGLARLPALVATLAYGLHPAQVEAVSWATGRKEIVALALACGAILLHLRSESPWSARSWGSRVLYVLAALAKTTVLPLPLVLFLADVLLKPEGTWRERIRRGALAHAPTLALGVGFGVVVMSIWESSQMVRPGLEGAGPLMLVASTVTHHVGHALAPFGASPVYPIHRDLEGFGFVDALGPLVLAVGLALPSPRGRCSLLAFVALLLPVSNLVPLYFEVQDRYLCLPLLPLAFGLGALVDAKPSRARVGLALAYVAFFAALTVRYEAAWNGDGALWRHAVQAQPEADYAWLKLGETLRDEALTQEGDEARLTFDRSIDAYDRAIRLAPSLLVPHVARLRVLAHRDELLHEIAPSRAAEFSTRYGTNQANAEALKDLASEMLELGYRDAALVPLGRALDLDPLPQELLENAARVQLERGHEWLARFYVSRLPAPSADPRLSF